MEPKKNQIIFMNGKEKALKSLFGPNGTFGYLAIGYNNEENDNGFVDPSIEANETESSGFQELTNYDYSRIPLSLYTVDDGDGRDEDSGKVLVKFSATLSEENIIDSQYINQIAVVEGKDQSSDTESSIYSATTFPSFVKTGNSSITFIIGFRL